MSYQNSQRENTLKALALAAVETCNTGVIILDRKNRVVLWNNWMVRRARIEAKMAVGQHFEGLFPELTHSQIAQAIQMALNQGMSSLLSQSLHGAPFPLFSLNDNPGPETERLQQMVAITPLNITDENTLVSCPENNTFSNSKVEKRKNGRYCLIQITDSTFAVKRETLLRTQAQQMQILANQYHAKEIYLQAILDNALDAIITTNEQGTIETFNPAAEKIFGLHAEEIIAGDINELLPELPINRPDIQDEPFLEFEPKKMIGLCREMLGKRKDNTKVPLEVSVSEMTVNDQQKFIGIMRDVTQRRQIEEALMREKERALVTLESIGDAVVTTDAQGMVQYMNPVAEQITGWRSQVAQGVALVTVFQLYGITGEAITESLFQRCMQEGRTILMVENTRLINRDDQIFYLEGTLAPIRTSQQIIGIVVAFHDVSKAYQMAHQLSYQATHDALTDLVNRTEFERRLTQLINTGYHDKCHHALCYMDLDQFKIVNDTCGHVAGDELLRQVTALLKTKIRSTDTLARLGGDEFGVLLQGCSLKKAQQIAETLRELIDDFRFVWENKTFSIGVSIGLVAINQQSDVSTILSAADTACYAAKDSGRNRICIYQSDNDELTQRHGQMQWASRVTQAVEEKRFVLFCQPIIPINGEKLENEPRLHVEILVRMLDEKNNIIPPMAFIPAAERYNMMSNIDRWVISQAFSTYAHLCSYHPHLSMNINISSLSLGDDYFLEFVHAKFKQYNIPSQVICFEITETTAIAHLNQALNFINSLKLVGCRFALDDFGSGLSSFAYLKNLPVDYLKIDGTFVKDMLKDPIDCAMVESINKVGHVMGLKTIAECVEDIETIRQLRKMGINYAQGYGIFEPIPLNELEKICPLSKSI